MPVVVASATRSADALISYALDDTPAQQGERYVMASGVGGLLVSVAKQQMRDVRKKWNKNKPGAFVHGYHVIQSFAKDELPPDSPDSWLIAQRLGRALAEDRFPGRQALIVTQRDGKSGCVHNHIVANSIETRTGRSLNSSIVMHTHLVEAHERVLEGEGFEQRADLKRAFADATDRRERGEPSGLRRASSSEQSELREFQRYILWETENDIAEELGVERNPEPFSLTVLKSRIEQTLADAAAIDWTSFVEAGRKQGVQVEQRGKKGRGISYGMLRQQPDGTLATPSASDRRRCSSLGVDFEMDEVERVLARNRSEQYGLSVAACNPSAVIRLAPSAAAADMGAPHGPSDNERLRSVLTDVNDEATPDTCRRTADSITVEALSAVGHESERSSQQFVASFIPRDTSPRTQRAAAEEVPESVDTSSGSINELNALESQAPSPAVEKGASDLRKINEAEGDAPVQSEPRGGAGPSASLQQRTVRMKFPELFDDTPRVTHSGEEGREVGD